MSTYTTVEELGDPTSTIMAVCEREKADLLIVGRRGAGLVERMVIGSVADRLAHHAPCPLSDRSVIPGRGQFAFEEDTAVE